MPAARSYQPPTHKCQNENCCLDLVEPAGMDWRMNQYNIGPFVSQASGGLLASMGGAVVCDEKHATGRTIRFPAHDLSDEALERSDAGLALAAAEQLGAMHVPGGEVGQCAGTNVFVLDVDRAPRGGRQ